MMDPAAMRGVIRSSPFMRVALYDGDTQNVP